MAAAIADLPAQLRAAAARIETLGLGLRGSYSEVAVLGLGGSAIGADLVRGALDDRLGVPLLVLRETSLPAWVGDRTLVVASSRSGRTEETITTAREALRRGAPTVALTTGGPLAELVAAAGGSVVTFATPWSPRASVGHSVGLLVGLLVEAGLLPLEVGRGELQAAADAAEALALALGRPLPSPRTRPSASPGRLLGHVPVIVGAGHLAPVARRWKAQLNENAKASAAWDELPELAHNSVVAFVDPAFPGERVFVVALASAAEPVRDRQRRGAVWGCCPPARPRRS